MEDRSYVTLDEGNFKSIVLESERPVLVDFWAGWCAPCRAIAPAIEQLARDFAGQATVGKVNVDDEPGLAQEYGIRAIPSLLLFRSGEVVDRIVGNAQPSELREKLAGAVAAA